MAGGHGSRSMQWLAIHALEVEKKELSVAQDPGLEIPLSIFRVGLPTAVNLV